MVFTWNWNGFVPKIRWRPNKNKKRSSLRFGPVLCPKLGGHQKKGLHPGWDWFLWPNSLQVHGQSRPILIADGRGAIFAFSTTISLKSKKCCILHTLHGNVEGDLVPPPPWLRYCTYRRNWRTRGEQKIWSTWCNDLKSLSNPQQMSPCATKFWKSTVQRIRFENLFWTNFRPRPFSSLHLTVIWRKKQRISGEKLDENADDVWLSSSPPSANLWFHLVTPKKAY